MIRPSRCASSCREPNDPDTWMATEASGRSMEKLATLLTTSLVISPVRNASNRRCRSLTDVAPVITGATSVTERQRLYDAFRAGEITKLVVSKVANFSIDLPEASVAIQVSGSFGSRQEEAQRLGRIMRPKADRRTARFYTVVARDTVDQEFAAHRQRFLAEQGYAYTIVDADDVLAG